MVTVYVLKYSKNQTKYKYEMTLKKLGFHVNLLQERKNN